MSGRKCRLMIGLLFVLLAGCGEIPTVPLLGQPTPTLAVSPSPPRPATLEEYPPPATPEAPPPPTTDPTTLPAPALLAQPVPEEWRTGERIAFLKGGNLWLAVPDGSVQVQVSASGNVTALYGWSYDCSQLLLGIGEWSALPETDVPGGRDLWILPVSDVEAYPVIQGQEVLHAAWSPASDLIAYHTADGNLYVTDSSVGVYRALLDDHSSTFVGAWSPDGTKIAFPRLTTSGEYWLNLAILDLATGSVLPTREEHRVDASPYVWSVDGSQILFQSGPSESSLWRYLDVEKNEIVPIQSEGLDQFVVNATGLSRSPVADQVAFGYYRLVTDVPAVWVMDLDGGNLRRLTDGIYPVWSPDGQKIAHTGTDGGLWVINLDGGGAIQITGPNQVRTAYEPCWCR